jgi:hypothetical protein
VLYKLLEANGRGIGGREPEYELLIQAQCKKTVE